MITPLLEHYPLAGVLTVAVGLYSSAYVSVSQGKALVGTLLTVGLTIIPAAGIYSLPWQWRSSRHWYSAWGWPSSACGWCTRCSLRSPARSPPKPCTSPGTPTGSPCALRADRAAAISVRADQPSLYLKLIAEIRAAGPAGLDSERAHGRPRIAGVHLPGGRHRDAVLGLLKLSPTLWMFFLWMLLFGIGFAAMIHGLFATRYSPSFWQNTAVTMLILLGSGGAGQRQRQRCLQRVRHAHGPVRGRHAVRLGRGVAARSLAQFVATALPPERSPTQLPPA